MTNPHARIDLARELIDLARQRLQIPEATDSEAIEEILVCLRWLGQEADTLIHPLIGSSKRRFFEELGSRKPEKGQGTRGKGQGTSTENSQES